VLGDSFAGGRANYVKIVELKARQALPPPTSGRDCANKMQKVA